MKLPLADRTAAGRSLAAVLSDYYRDEDVVVLALPRGGVPVAREVAAALDATLDLILIRKLGVPMQPELAMGAIASGGVRVLNPDVVQSWRITGEDIAAVAAIEQRELERREAAYRGERPRPPVRGRTVILVDDGVATGATMRAAISALRQLGPAKIVVAVPVAPADTVQALEEVADEVVCLATPEPFFAIGSCYRDFTQVSDEEVRRLLEVVPRREAERG
jgi:putative phosphoribosyl transferase